MTNFTKQDFTNLCIILGIVLMILATPASLFTQKYLLIFLEGLAVFITGIIFD